MSFKIDFTEFNKKFDKLSDKFTDKYADEATYNALAALKFDADNIKPTTPKKIGTLRSAVIFENKGMKTKTAASLTWKMPYARKLHEAPENWNWSKEGSGPDYVESKLRTRKEVYLEIMGRTYKSKI